MNTPRQLPTITLKRNGYEIRYTIDFRLCEIRVKAQPHVRILFADLTEEEKAKIRGVRFRETQYNYIKDLDD